HVVHSLISSPPTPFTPLPYTTLFRSHHVGLGGPRRDGLTSGSDQRSEVFGQYRGVRVLDVAGGSHERQGPIDLEQRLDPLVRLELSPVGLDELVEQFRSMTVSLA